MGAEEEITVNNQELISKERELFITLFEADRKRLYAYIFTFMGNSSAADDIFQETSMTLWKEFSSFQPGTNFSKWANGIAFNRIRTYRRKNKKYSLGLSDSMLESLSQTEAANTEEEKKWRILQDCRSNLPDHSRELYENFYVKNLKAQEVADSSGRSIFAIRKAIHKLRKKIFDCVDSKRQERMQ